MAEAFANHYGKGKVVASSAGVKLAERVNPLVVDVMKEKGIDISGNKPKLLSPKMAEVVDQIISMGCSVEEVCPAIRARVRNVVDWDLEDPKGKPMEKVREIRNEVERKVLRLLAEIEEPD